MANRILLLEDDVQLNETIHQFLELQGFEVIPAFDAYEAQDKIYENNIDLLLLDVKVPYQSGFDLLSELRSSGDNTPAIFITSLHTVDDLTRGFKAGCDDYIRKPFSLEELQLRIEANIKKSHPLQQETVMIDENISFESSNDRLVIGEKAVQLKHKEARLLELFLSHSDQILTYQDIYDALWEYDEEPNSASLRTFVHAIRSHIGKNRIETIKNIGYRYAAK